MKAKGIIFIVFGVLCFFVSEILRFSDSFTIILFLVAAVSITAGILSLRWQNRQEPSESSPPSPQAVSSTSSSSPSSTIPKKAASDAAHVGLSHYSDSRPSMEIIPLSKPDMSYLFTEEDHAEIMAMKDFCVLDVETTGLDYRHDRIVQIGIIKLKDLVPVDRLNTLVNPEIPIPARASEIHGITDADVVSAPKYSDIADRVFSLLNNTTVVGHNVTFDLNFIQYLLLCRSDRKADLTMDYIDTWQYARQVHHGLSDYKLQTLLKYYDIDPGAAHTAYDDAFATLKLFHALRYEYEHKDEIAAARDAERKEARRLARESEKDTRRSAFAASPLLEQKFCFTGDFSIDRQSMENLAASVGALVQEKEPSRNTAYLVKGDVSGLPEWALDRKLRKAESLIASGKPVKIIDESEYLRLISEARQALSQARAGGSP